MRCDLETVFNQDAAITLFQSLSGFLMRCDSAHRVQKYVLPCFNPYRVF